MCSIMGRLLDENTRSNAIFYTYPRHDMIEQYVDVHILRYPILKQRIEACYWVAGIVLSLRAAWPVFDSPPLSTISTFLVVRSPYLWTRVNPAGPEPMPIKSYDSRKLLRSTFMRLCSRRKIRPPLTGRAAARERRRTWAQDRPCQSEWY